LTFRLRQILFDFIYRPVHCTCPPGCSKKAKTSEASQKTFKPVFKNINIIQRVFTVQFLL